MPHDLNLWRELSAIFPFIVSIEAGRHNADRSLRTRSLVGVMIVRGLRETAPGVWSEGSLYNPDDGRSYTGTIHLRDGVLELRGCALNVFCETQTWRRPEDVIATANEAAR